MIKTLRDALEMHGIPKELDIETITAEFAEKTGRSPNMLLLPHTVKTPVTWVYGMHIGYTTNDKPVVGRTEAVK